MLVDVKVQRSISVMTRGFKILSKQKIYQNLYITKLFPLEKLQMSYHRRTFNPFSASFFFFPSSCTYLICQFLTHSIFFPIS